MGIERCIGTEQLRSSSALSPVAIAKMAEQPTHNSDLELFTREITWDTRPTISKLWSPLAFGILGFSLAAGANFFARRPVMSGIQKHIALVCLGVPVGLFAQTKLDERFAKRDAELVRYMQTHPERFPVTERQKFKDTLRPWIPIR